MARPRKYPIELLDRGVRLVFESERPIAEVARDLGVHPEAPKEELRTLYRDVPAHRAAEHLDAWLAWAQRSKLKPFVRLARTLREHRDGILQAVRLGLSNGRLEGLNSKVRLISHRSFGFHSAAALIALVYLCCGGIEVELPLS